MKKLSFALALTLVATLFALSVGCGQESKKISGVYIREWEFRGVRVTESYDFREGGNVLYDGKGIAKTPIRRKGTWKLTDGKLVASMWDEEIKEGEDNIFGFEGNDLILTATKFRGKTADAANHRYRKQ